jgi:hypothetical protein
LSIGFLKVFWSEVRREDHTKSTKEEERGKREKGKGKKGCRFDKLSDQRALPELVEGSREQ